MAPFWPISNCPRLKTAQKTTKSLFSAGGGPTKKRLFPRMLRKTVPDSVVTFFSGFGTPFAVGPEKGPEGLACLLDAQAPHSLINRLNYYVLQLGDPNPNAWSPLGPKVSKGWQHVMSLFFRCCIHFWPWYATVSMFSGSTWLTIWKYVRSWITFFWQRPTYTYTSRACCTSSIFSLTQKKLFAGY